MTKKPSIQVILDPANPGHFFSCCAILGLSDNLWGSAYGWFSESPWIFNVDTKGNLADLISALSRAEIECWFPEDITSTPFTIGSPFSPLHIDWWYPEQKRTKDFKVWAGTMESFGIARALQKALCKLDFNKTDIFDTPMVVESPDQPGKKKEPYYFDARRATNAHSRDIGFAPNDLKMNTVAYPAVELLCLIGLQFALPAFTNKPRIFDYFTWNLPLPLSLLSSAACGALGLSEVKGFRFESWYRTSQKKHKAFCFAKPLTNGDL